MDDSLKIEDEHGNLIPVVRSISTRKGKLSPKYVKGKGLMIPLILGDYNNGGYESFYMEIPDNVLKETIEFNLKEEQD